MKSLSKVLVPLVLVVLFGKIIPLLIVAGLLIGLVVIIDTAVKEGKEF